MMTRVPWRTFFLLILVLLAVLIPFCLFGSRINTWTNTLLQHATTHPFQTGLLLALLLTADILIPVPSSLVSTACGLTLGFIGGTCASFVGMTLSAILGLLLGRYASGAAQRLIGTQELVQLQRFQARFGIWLLLALRPVPILAEASVVFSGFARQPFWRAVAVTSLGNLAVSAMYAAVGVWGQLSDSFLPAFGVSMGVAGALMFCLRRT